MKNLPVGISTLSKIIENDMVYIDKTHHVFRLASTAGVFFLARPRRFGKSLFIDTLKEIFEGNRDLFKGLYIYDKWNWHEKYPVMKIDFTGGVIRNLNELNNKFESIISRYEKIFGITTSNHGISNRFSELIINVSEKTGSKVVVLVDEYDKPLLDNIENSSIAMEMREGLKNFYWVLKEMDAYIHFIFLTGVSKFSKVNIFSGINNLNDITLNPNFSTICGYTQNNLETSFGEHLEGVDWDKLKEWYNGYRFMGEPVYNPFDILLFISNKRQFRNYWFETGTPTFLIKLFQKNRYFLPQLEDIEVGEEILSSFEVENINPISLLYQTGYLTILEHYTKSERLRYRLAYPNREVKQSLNTYFIHGYTLMTAEKGKHEDSTYEALYNADLSGLEMTIKRLFAGVPWHNFTNNDLVDYEGYYASVLYAFFSAINCTIIPEDINNQGQADLTVRLGKNIYIIEIKVVDDENQLHGQKNPALEQIQKRHYSDKYKGIKDVSVFEVGIIFSKKIRNLVMFGWVQL
jgi:hypothetical protein